MVTKVTEIRCLADFQEVSDCLNAAIFMVVISITGPKKMFPKRFFLAEVK